METTNQSTTLGIFEIIIVPFNKIEDGGLLAVPGTPEE
jgi:hypothetical protein